MHVVTTILLFLAGFSLAFTAVKVLVEFPRWTIRWLLYALVIGVYLVIASATRQTDFASWFHFVWSLVLMVLVIGLFRRQGDHVIRLCLYVLGSVVLISLLFAAAYAGHRQTEIWLHQSYIRTTSFQLFPLLMLCALPSGMAVGTAFSTIGVLTNRQTGHANALHWSWWCAIWTVGVFALVVMSVIGNDLEMRYGRDSIQARANQVKRRIEELVPSRDRTPLTASLAMLKSKAWRDYSPPPTETITSDSKSVVFRQYGEWMTTADSVLNPVRNWIDDDRWDELSGLLPSEVTWIANIFLTSGTYKTCTGELQAAVQDILCATRLVDRAIAPNAIGCNDLFAFERKRVDAIQRLIANCEDSEVGLPPELITEKPYEGLGPVSQRRFTTELNRIRQCKVALRTFANNHILENSFQGFAAFGWRLLALRRVIPIAEQEINFPVPTKSSLPVAGAGYYEDAQLDRMIANSAIRAAQAYRSGAIVPSRDEIFTDPFTEKQLETIGFFAAENGWAVWRCIDPRDEEVAAACTTAELLSFLAKRRSVIIGPLYHQLELQVADAAVTSERFIEFQELLRSISPKSTFFALPTGVAYNLHSQFSDVLLSPYALLDAASKAEGARTLNIGDKWFEMGLCFLNNPNGSLLELDGLQLVIPTAHFHRYDYQRGEAILTTLTTVQSQQVAKALVQLTEKDLKLRYDAIASPAFAAVGRFGLGRPLYSFEVIQRAVDELRNFYIDAEKDGHAIMFCPNPGEWTDNANAGESMGGSIGR